jgi:hypothetical protein
VGTPRRATNPATHQERGGLRGVLVRVWPEPSPLLEGHTVWETFVCSPSKLASRVTIHVIELASIERLTRFKVLRRAPGNTKPELGWFGGWL